MILSQLGCPQWHAEYPAHLSLSGLWTYTTRRDITDLFSGDYSNFKTRRSSRYENKSYQSNSKLAAESLKTFLSPEQIQAWANCKTGKIELALHFENVTKQGAVLVAEWTRDSVIGELKINGSKLDGATESSLPDFKTLKGKRAFILGRSPLGGAVTVVISGKAAAKTDISESAYLPPFEEPQKAPERIVTSVAGRVKTSVFSWSYGKLQGSKECLQPNDNQDLVVIETHGVALGKNKGECLRNDPRYGNVCDSAGESCTDIVVVSGCLVNKTWHDWYKQNNKLTPYSAHAVCD